MFKINLITTLIILALGAGSAWWIWQGFDRSMQQHTMTIPQHSIVGYDYVETNTIGADFAEIEAQYKNLKKQVENTWGLNEIILPTPSKFVKYSQNYQVRSVVDFETGDVWVEAIAPVYPKRSLKDAIVSMALAPASPAVDIFSAKDIILSDNPALYGQLLNKQGESMRQANRAQEYATQLLGSGIDERMIIVHGKPQMVYRISTTLADADLKTRASKYESIISDVAARYGLGERLLYSIAHTESSFNPFAVSPASAYGLMQVVPSSAGAEVYEFLNDKKGKPSREFLFEPANNIEYGAAYLHILANRYFGDVKDVGSRELCMIAAYNGGPGAVQRSFAPKQQAAIQKINSMSREQVYRHLLRNLPANETRRYVDKVLVSLGVFTSS